MHTAAAVTFNGGEKVTEIPRGMSVSKQCAKEGILKYLKGVQMRKYTTLITTN